MVEFPAESSGTSVDDLTQEPCSSWTNVNLVYPEQIQPSPGFGLIHDDALARLAEAFRAGKGVHATFEGRIDIAFVWHAKKRITIGTEKGYGKKSRYGGRFILQKVSDVVVYPGARL